MTQSSPVSLNQLSQEPFASASRPLRINRSCYNHFDQSGHSCCSYVDSCYGIDYRGLSTRPHRIGFCIDYCIAHCWHTCFYRSFLYQLISCHFHRHWFHPGHRHRNRHDHCSRQHPRLDILHCRLLDYARQLPRPLLSMRPQYSQITLHLQCIVQ